MEIKYNWKPVKGCKEAFGKEFSISTSGMEKDFLYRATLMEYKQKDGLKASLMISPYPKCCGIRVINASSVPYGFSKTHQDAWNTFVCKVIALDNNWNYPGRYQFVTNGTGNQDGSNFKSHNRISLEIFNFLDQFAKERQTHYNPIMNSVCRTSHILVGKDASVLGEQFKLSEKESAVTFF